MDEIIMKIITTVVGIAVTGLIGWLTGQIVKYKKLTKKEEDETIKNTIKNSLSEELQPIKEDISNMKNDIGNLQKFEDNFSTRLKPTQSEIEHLKDDITEILDALEKQGIDLENIKEKEEVLENETRCAWRYRIRQLCHVYIARGYMSYEEYTQL
jgi:peptidoglycan hydrolase CwlO-like protein